MYVLAQSNHLHPVSDSLPDLNSLISKLNGLRIRRIDRFIQLGLAGALLCSKQRPPEKDCGMVISTGCGTVSTVATIMETVYRKHHSPKPLHFINSLGNSACFYIAKSLGINGNSTAVAQSTFSFEAALTNANAQFSRGEANTILVGGIDEAPLPIEHQRARLNADERYTHFYEGSHWLMLSAEKPAQPEAQILLHEPEHIETLEELEKRLEDHPNAQRYFNFIPETPLINRRNVQQHFPQANCYPHACYSGSCVSTASSKLRKSEKKVESAWVISKHSELNRYCVSLLEKIA